MSITAMTDAQLIHKLEEKFGRDLSNIVPAPEEFDKRHHHTGDRVFKCLDIELEAILSVDTEGFVTTRLLTSKYTDVLGQIK